RLVALPWTDDALVTGARPAVLDLGQLLTHAVGEPGQRPRFLVVVDDGFVRRFVAVEALHELLPLRHLPFENPSIIALIADDVGRQEEEQVGLGLLGALVAEQPAHDRQRAEQYVLVYFPVGQEITASKRSATLASVTCP